MESFIEQCANIIQTHQAWAGPVVGLIAFGESLILIGILLPGTAVLVIVGGLVGAGVIEPIPVLIGSAAGAAIGDMVSYFLGIRLGRGVAHKWPLNQHKQAVARARLFFRRYGVAAVFIGRFFGPVRSTVPFVAGMMRMERHRFQIANFLSAVVWAPVVLSPGWLVAKGASNLIETSESNWLGIGAIALAAAAIAAIVVIKLVQGTRGRRRIRATRRNAPAGLAAGRGSAVSAPERGT